MNVLNFVSPTIHDGVPLNAVCFGWLKNPEAKAFRGDSWIGPH